MENLFDIYTLTIIYLNGFKNQETRGLDVLRRAKILYCLNSCSLPAAKKMAKQAFFWPFIQVRTEIRFLHPAYTYNMKYDHLETRAVRTPYHMAVISFKKLIFAFYEMFVFYLISFLKAFWQCARILGFHPVITKLCDI